MLECSASSESPPSLPSKRRGNPNWIKGISKPAPVGNGRKATGFADPSSRTKVLLEKYTPAQILDFAKNIAKAPLSTPDAVIIMHIANVLERNGLERERLYDRTFGKVPDKKINLNVNIDATPEQLSERALAVLARLQG
jgi:hypothetical protein